MKKLGRPRKAHALRKENISVNLPKTLVSEVESQLSYRSSRSEWIELAIVEKLNGSFTVSEAETKNLLLAARLREDIDPFVKKVIDNYLKPATPVEGTEEEQ